jgi:hypothetical protein
MIRLSGFRPYYGIMYSVLCPGRRRERLIIKTGIKQITGPARVMLLNKRACLIYEAGSFNEPVVSDGVHPGREYVRERALLRWHRARQ